MPGYISEISYGGNASADFIEVVVPEGTDVSLYSVVVYKGDGTVEATFSFGSVVSTADGSDVYLFDSGTPGFTNINSNDAVALVDDLGNVIQFISFGGNTVTATEGPADGLTSSDIGTAAKGESLQTNDDGSSYFVQTNFANTWPSLHRRPAVNTPPNFILA